MRTWTAEQLAYFAAARDSDRNLAVSAVAGSGKTTSSLETTRNLRGSVMFTCFSNPVATEIRSKAPPGVIASTLHAAGLRVCGRAFRGIQLEEYKFARIIQKIRPEWHFKGRRSDNLILIERYKPVFETVEWLYSQDLRPSQFSCSHDIWTNAVQFGVEFENPSIGVEICEGAADLWTESTNQLGTLAYPEMVSFPLIHNLVGSPLFANVVIDECQDLNPAQQMLGTAMGQRVLAVGDPRQAIMGFAGADENSYETLSQLIDAMAVPLSTCFRCPTSHLDMARVLVPWILPAPGAQVGEINECTIQDMARGVVPGQMVICRNNAPLVNLAYRLAAEGKPATVKGRNIGRGLTTLIKSFGRLDDLSHLMAKLEAWRQVQIAGIMEAGGPGRDRAVEAVVDKAECLASIVYCSTTLEEVVDSITRLFSDQDDSRRVVLSSVHKSKGLESDVVWFYEPGLFPGGGGAASQQELNLLYVALTRSKRVLNFVDSAASRRLLGVEWVQAIASGCSRKDLMELEI